MPLAANSTWPLWASSGALQEQMVHCASVNQHMVVNPEEHALFECTLYHDIRQQQSWAQQRPRNLHIFLTLPPLQ